MPYSNTRLAGVLAVAATLAMPALAVAQTANPATPAAPHTTPMTPATPAAPHAAPMAPGTSTTTTTTAPADDMAMMGGIRASKIIGASVMNDHKDSIGTVEDLIITENEKVPTAVLSVGGFLGIGTKYVAVPFSDLKVTNNKDVMMTGATKASLKALPEFKFPDEK
jgi:sporulation protein YlmC with PRC-barrel domain